jgi:isoleucyl-tRNA synthetase
MAREFVNRVQNLRKDSGLDVTDRIRLKFSCDAELATALQSQRDYIMLETLAVEFVADESNSSDMLEFDINGQMCRIALERMATGR